MNNQQQAAELVVGLLHARTIAHIMHLRTRSYAEHVALGAFYTAIGDLADSLCETLQGRYELLPLAAPTSQSDIGDPVAYLRALASFVEKSRPCCSDSDVQNQIDEVASLIAGTLYKLRFLA